MQLPSDLSVPVYLKTVDFVWPQDKMFYLLSKDGLFLCRNHPWFTSCSPAKTGPSDLLSQKATCEVEYPAIPRALVEKAVSFFRRVFEDHHWESALILVYNRLTQEVELICPDQTCSWGSVHYDIPILQPHQALIGDFHSHCDFSPNPSSTDEGDEMNRPGLHLIAGYITDKKPSFHCVVVADGQRFTIDSILSVIEGFESCDPKSAPKEWLDKVKEYKYTYTHSQGGFYDGSDYDSHTGSRGGFTSWFKKKPDKQDKEIINHVLDEFLTHTECPREDMVRTRLFSRTKHCSYLYCEKRAKQFVEAWRKAKGNHDHRTQTESDLESEVA